MLIVLAAAASWIPAVFSRGDAFWLGLSSNLFASAVTVLGTVFGIELLLEAAQRRSPASAAVRESVIANVSWVLNRLYSIDRIPFDAEVSGLAELKSSVRFTEVDRLPAMVASAWVAKGPSISVAIGRRPLETVIEMADEVVAKVESFRLIIGVSRAAMPEVAVAALLSAVTVIDVVKTWTVEARATLTATDEESLMMRNAYAPMLGGLLSGAVEHLCEAYNAVSADN